MHPPKLAPGVVRDVTRARLARTVAPQVMNDPTRRPPVIVKGNCTRLCFYDPLIRRYRCTTIC